MLAHLLLVMSSAPSAQFLARRAAGAAAASPSRAVRSSLLSMSAMENGVRFLSSVIRAARVRCRLCAIVHRFRLILYNRYRGTGRYYDSVHCPSSKFLGFDAKFINASMLLFTARKREGRKRIVTRVALVVSRSGSRSRGKTLRSPSRFHPHGNST